MKVVVWSQGSVQLGVVVMRLLSLKGRPPRTPPVSIRFVYCWKDMHCEVY